MVTVVEQDRGPERLRVIVGARASSAVAEIAVVLFKASIAEVAPHAVPASAAAPVWEVLGEALAVVVAPVEAEAVVVVAVVAVEEDAGDR